MPTMGIRVLPIGGQALIVANHAVRQRHGLLTMESMSVLLIEREGARAIATLGRDFLRLPDLEA